MQPPERSIVFAAFNSAPNAEEMIPTFSAMAAHPLLGERAGVREGVFQPRWPDAHPENPPKACFRVSSVARAHQRFGSPARA